VNERDGAERAAKLSVLDQVREASAQAQVEHLGAGRKLDGLGNGETEDVGRDSLRRSVRDGDVHGPKEDASRTPK
jgi:hypothetical protein